jgi:hypothetical protein
MKKEMIVIAMVMLAALTACGTDRYSVEVGPVATPVPTAAPVPTQAPQIIIVQPPPAPVQPSPAVTDETTIMFFAVGVIAMGILVLTAIALIYVWKRPTAAPAAPPHTPVHSITNHYHYHASAPPLGAPEMPPPPVLPEGWTIQRKATWLMSAGYTVEEARAIIDSQHRAKQLPPAK